MNNKTENNEEKFPKPISKEAHLKKALSFLEETRFNFACFVDHFKMYAEKLLKGGSKQNGNAK